MTESNAPPVSPPPSSPPVVVQFAPPRRPLWKRLLVRGGVALLVFVILINFYMMVLTAGTLTQTLQTHVVRDGNKEQVVAVLPIDGMIDDSTAAFVDQFCDALRDRPEVKALVLRVDSPGGSVSASDRIYHRLQGLRKDGKPIVVSMGGLAASGGYYISMPGQHLVAEPTTLTGSIGVIAAMPVVSDALKKIGVNMLVVRSRSTEAWKAAPNLLETPAPYQVEDLRDLLDKMQQRFDTIVQESRGIARTPVEKTYVGADGKPLVVQEAEPFNGRAYLAEQAKALGLIDEIGYIETAYDKAASLAKLDRPRIVRYERRRSFREQIGLSAAPGAVIDRKLLEELQTPRVLMLWRVDH